MSRVFNRTEIEEILPHRYPFLFVDEVNEIVPGEKIIGLVRVADSGMFLSQDESGKPYFPATLLTEAMAQVGAILILNPSENRGRTIYFRSIDKASFHQRAPAGSAIRIEGVVRRLRGRLGALKMTAFLDGEIAAEAVMGFALSD